MIDDTFASLSAGMGLFRTTITITPWPGHAERRELHDVLVDTGTEYTWIARALLEELGVEPARTERFETADGRIFERDVGFAMVFTSGRAAPTIVVFAEGDDTTLLGAVALEGLNLRVDLVRKELVPAGPVIVAVGLRPPSSAEAMEHNKHVAKKYRNALRALAK